jgi:tetratricopeptide (TPR) repeat protein
MRFLLVLLLLHVSSFLQTGPPDRLAAALELMAQQRYNAAISKLEEVLETSPKDARAIGYLGTAQLYARRDFTKAQKLLEEALGVGGDAAFWVNHSHEKLTSGEMTEYCRGWLHVRKGEVEFAPADKEHAFRLTSSEIKEFKQNRMSKTLFHIQADKKTYNFRPRTGDEREVWLIIALFNKYSR